MKKTILLLALSLVAPTSYSSASCPPSIDVSIAVDRPSSFTAHNTKNRLNLSDVDFLVGDPSLSNKIEPGQRVSKNGITEIRWGFDRESRSSVLLACRYNGTRVFLTQPLPENTSWCRVRQQELEGGMRVEVIDFSCR